MSYLPPGYKVVELDERTKELEKPFKGHTSCIQLKPHGWTLTNKYKEVAKHFKDFEFDEGDVLLMTFPKSGTTWTQEIIWCMMNNRDLNHPMADLSLNIRSPYLDTEMLIENARDLAHPSFTEMFNAQFPDYKSMDYRMMHVARMSPKPRVLKSHLSFDLLSDTLLNKAKVVYVIRDPRDTCLSYYHHCRLFRYEDFQGTLDQFVDAFLGDAVMLGPYWSSVSEAWKRRDHPNMHIMFYEQMKKDIMKELHKLNKFLGTDLNEEQLKKLAHYTSFSEMKKRDNHVVGNLDKPIFMNLELAQTAGGFFKTGETGGWQKLLSQEQKDRFQAWIEEKSPDPKIMETILNP